jgi:hypothetical protein
MWMSGVIATKVDDFSITVDGSLLIFSAVLSDVAFHQPCLGMIRFHVQYSIQKNLSNFPSFFGNRARGM